MRRRLVHITYANVVATLALVFAMTGGAYALVVNGALVVDESLTEADIRNGSLGASIAPGAVTGTKVADDSLTGADIDESTLAGLTGSGGDAFARFGQTELGPEYRPVISKTLRPGSYVLQGVLSLENRTSVEQQVTCGIAGGLHMWNPRVTVPAGHAGSISLLEPTRIGPAPSEVQVICSSGRIPDGQVTAFGELVAISVASVEDRL